MISPDADAIDATMISSLELSNESVESTKKQIEKYLSASFNSLVTKSCNIIEEIESQSLTDVQGGKFNLVKLIDEKNSKKNCVSSIADYLIDSFKKVQSDVLEKVISFIDHRLIHDQKAFANIKTKCLKQLHDSRDSSILYKKILETSMIHKLSESNRTMREEFRETLTEENTNITRELTTLQSTYEILWSLHDDVNQQLQHCEKTILKLNDDVQISFDTINTLREKIIITKQKHEEFIERMLKEIKRRFNKNKIKDPKISIALNLDLVSFDVLPKCNNNIKNNNDNDNYDDNDNDNDTDSIDSVVDKNIDTSVCVNCLNSANQIADLRIALNSAIESLEINKNKIKRNIITGKNIKLRRSSRSSKNDKNENSLHSTSGGSSDNERNNNLIISRRRSSNDSEKSYTSTKNLFNSKSNGHNHNYNSRKISSSSKITKRRVSTLLGNSSSHTLTSCNLNSTTRWGSLSTHDSKNNEGGMTLLNNFPVVYGSTGSRLLSFDKSCQTDGSIEGLLKISLDATQQAVNFYHTCKKKFTCVHSNLFIFHAIINFMFCLNI